MESYEKLVRDNIPDILTEKGIPFEQHTASPEEYEAELLKKFEEEFKEFSTDKSPEELADVIEVVEALKKLDRYKDVEAIREKKKKEKGAFEKRVIVKGEK